MCDYNQFSLPLIPTGDESGFRIKDAPGEVHRLAVVEQSVSGVFLQGNIKEAIHGTLTPNGTPASLIIIEFSFRMMHHSLSIRRFHKVTIKLRFFDPSEPEGGNDPAVVKVAPHEFNWTVSRKEVRHKARVGIHSGVESGNLMTLGAGYERETPLTRETQWTTISNLIMHDQYRIWGGKNSAYWCFSGNQDEQNGAPTTTTIRVAVLLQRKKAAGQFLMTADIDTKVDIQYSARVNPLNLIGRLVRDDAITFDPDPKYALPTERSDLDSENLGLCDLENGYPGEKVPVSDKVPGPKKMRNSSVVLYKPVRGIPQYHSTILSMGIRISC